MLMGNPMDVSPEVLRSALPLARSLFSDTWLDQQKLRKATDPLLYTEIPMASNAGVARALREGIPQTNEMHPLAEAVLGTERILAYFDRTGEFYSGIFAYRLLSLRDVATNLDAVISMRDRLPRLMGDQWLAALYELLVASSQARLGKVELIEETGERVPDMVLDSAVFLECKAKTQYAEEVLNFISRFKRLALDKIFQEVAKIGDGLLIEIDVHNDAAITDLPHLLRAMFTNRLTRRSTVAARIKLTPYASGPFNLPHPMKVHSAELWLWLMNFTGWRDWHFVQPYGEFEIENVSNMIVKSVRRPVLVCVRSSAISRHAQNVRATIASACRRQLKNHQPGIVRVLVNSELYGIGPNSDAATIKTQLDSLSLELLDSYSRLVGVRFDIVTPPVRGDLQVHYTSAGAGRRSQIHDLEATLSAPGILLL
jgi:hypothetical protein